MPTPRLGAPEWEEDQEAPDTTGNEIIRHVEQGANSRTFLSRSETAPPASPNEADEYLIPVSATGAWSSHVGEIAFWLNTNWVFIEPYPGILAFVEDESGYIGFDGSVWNGIGLVVLDDDTLGGGSPSASAPPSERAVKVYVDDAVTGAVAGAVTGLLRLKGSTDCSANPNYPAAVAGEAWRVSVAGKIGGASGITVDAGDVYYAVADNAGGTQASVGSSWDSLEHNGIFGAAFTDEQVRDAIGAALTDSGLAVVTPNDGADTIDVNVPAASTTEQLTGTETGKASTPDSVAALWEKGADVASSGTISLGDGGYFFITGTTTITDVDFATDKAGRSAWVKFAGVLTLTHNASTLILPTGASITTAAGDTACFISEGSDVVRCVAYQRASGAPLTGGGGGGSGTYRKVFKPNDNEPPASNYASLDTRNSRACLDFDGTTSESALFSDVLSSGYGGGGLTVRLIIRATSATSGDCKFEVSFERCNTDSDSDSFATAKSVTMTVNGTSGISTTGSISFSNSEIDGLLAGEEYYIKVTRLPADAADTVASDIELSKVEVAE